MLIPFYYLTLFANFPPTKQTIMKACPKCKSTSKHRMPRKPLVKLYPGTKAYACDVCNTTYTWFPIINLSLKV